MNFDPLQTSPLSGLGATGDKTEIGQGTPAVTKLFPNWLVGAAKPEDLERDSYAQTGVAELVDRSLHAASARFTMGLSPASLAGAYLDWAVHLAVSPGKQLLLWQKAMRKAWRLSRYALQDISQSDGSAYCIEPLAQDKRFAAEAWQQLPFNLIQQGFLLNQQWWHNAMTDVRGVSSPALPRQ